MWSERGITYRGCMFLSYRAREEMANQMKESSELENQNQEIRSVLNNYYRIIFIVIMVPTWTGKMGKTFSSWGKVREF